MFCEFCGDPHPNGVPSEKIDAGHPYLASHSETSGFGYKIKGRYKSLSNDEIERAKNGGWQQKHMTYQQKLRQAAKNWLAMNPNSGKTEVQVSATIAKNNARKKAKPCSVFDYSGTIWCDNCGHERAAHV